MLDTKIGRYPICFNELEDVHPRFRATAAAPEAGCCWSSKSLFGFLLEAERPSSESSRQIASRLQWLYFLEVPRL